MKEHYPYRFKVESEFISEFGYDWRKIVSNTWNSNGYMDYLFGQPYPYFIKKGYSYLDGIDNRWSISWDMLTENKPLEPSYKPKEKVIRTI